MSFRFSEFSHIMHRILLRKPSLSTSTYQIITVSTILLSILLVSMNKCSESQCSNRRKGRNPCTEGNLVVQRSLLDDKSEIPTNNHHKKKKRKSDLIKMLNSKKYRTCAEVFRGDLDIKWTPHQMKYVNEFKDSIRNIAMKFGIGIEGNSGDHRDMYRLYFEIAQLDFIKTVCETGFNAGHSAFMWLNANPDLVVYSFDIDVHNYTRPMVYKLQSMFPGRLHLTYGDSRNSIPHFRWECPEVQCDLVIVDGGHHADIPAWDLDNFRYMVPRNRDNLVILDDWPGRWDVNLTIGNMWRERVKARWVKELFQCLKFNNIWDSGITLGEYL